MLKQPLSLTLSLSKEIWRKSWTKLWGYIQMGGAATMAGLSELHTYITDPTLKDYLGQLDLPKYVVTAFAIAGIITWLAHGRESDA